MKYRLDVQHYINDRLLEPGHIIGDETDVPFVDAKGHPMVPSRGMTPLDHEARAHMEKAFPGVEMPERDPTKAIPIRGSGDSAKQPGIRQPGGPVGVTDGGHVIGPDGKPTMELKKGLPDSGTPNAPVGQPVIGTVSAPGTTPHIPAKPEDPNLAVKGPQAQQPAQQPSHPAPKPTEPSKR